MILIIAEKPSLGRNIAAGIELKTGATMVKKNGYLEGGGYLVSWAFGHLFSLADIEEYTQTAAADGSESGKKKHWTMTGLPCFPDEFRFRLRSGDDGVRRQFELLRTLCRRADVDTVVNAGDADREGEIIVRLCVREALDTPSQPDSVVEKRCLRLWLPDQTPKTVAAALGEMKEETVYDNLANEGFARTYIDWLYGVNLTRYATIKCGTLLRVGRVIVPIVQAIYDRDMSIRNFKPEIYFAVVGAADVGDEHIEVTAKAHFTVADRAKGEELCRSMSKTVCRVTDKKVKKEILPPGKLYSLSKLQNVLGKKYKMSMADSLAAVQKLYEAGYLTYPRTNSEYLATAEQDKVKEVIAGLTKLGYPLAFRFHKSIFDDSKIESHSALTPTYKIPDKGRLSPEEAQVYGTVVRRFAAVFCKDPCRVEKTELTLTLDGGEAFTLRGTVIRERGWTALDDSGLKDKLLPNLNVGDIVLLVFSLQEKETTPPRHYTIETLNNYLKNPFREDKAAIRHQSDGDTPEDDDEDYRAIFEGLELGTEATRTSIIDNARKSGYIDLKKDVYSILPGGEFLIESLTRMRITMDKYKTSTVGQALKRVFHGKMTVHDSVLLAEGEIRAIFHPPAQAPEDDTETGCFGDRIGTCPLCGREVSRGRYAYGCLGYKEGCRFRIPLFLCGRPVPIAAARALLRDGVTPLLRGFVSKTGKPFDAMLKTDGDRVGFAFPPDTRRTSGGGNYAIQSDPADAPPPEDPPPSRFDRA